MSRAFKTGLLVAAFSVLAVGPLNAGAVQENPYMQQCLNRCSMENSIRWSACSANGATNPSVEACRNLSYQLYSACVTGCYSG